MIQFAPQIKGLIFDCDGTLVNTIPSHLLAYQEVLHAHGADVPNDFLLGFNGYADPEIMAKVKEVYGGV